MATDNIRTYFVLDLGATRTLGQIGNLRSAAAGKPFISQIINYAATHNQPHNQFNVGRLSTNPANRYVWGEFEVDNADADIAQTFIDAQCANRSIVQPTYRLRIEALLQAEIREAGSDLGFGAAITNTFVVSVVGFGARDTAIAQSTANMITNCTQWGDC